jgi:hypothetical protein
MDKRAAKRIAGQIVDYINEDVYAGGAAENILMDADESDHAVIAWRAEREAADVKFVKWMARRTEGLAGAEIQRREAERWVAVLATTLALVKPQTKYLRWTAPDVEPVNIQERIAREQGAPIGLDGSVARFPRPPHDDVYLGHTDEYADAYARNDLLVLFGGEPDEDPRERTYVPRHDIIGSRVARGSALYHQHLATLSPQVPR